MGASSFLSGLMSGVTAQSSKQDGKLKGILARKKKKKNPPTPPTVSLPEDSTVGIPRQFKRGGKVKKTGMAKMHKGERVLTKKQAKRFKRR